jgi:hypothetical protein
MPKFQQAIDEFEEIVPIPGSERQLDRTLNRKSNTEND